MSRPWTYPELREAAWRIAAGEEVAAVAARLGRTPNALKLAIERLGPWEWGDLVAWGKDNARWPAVVKYLVGELTAEQAGASVGLTERGFLSHINRTGLSGVRDRHASRRRTEAEERRCYCLRTEGATYPQIAQATGIPRPTVVKLVKRYKARMASWRGAST